MKKKGTKTEKKSKLPTSDASRIRKIN